MEETEAIFLAVKRGASRRELEELVEGGADFRTKNDSGESILHLAAMKGNLDAVAYFLSKGIPVDSRNTNQMTPLMDAVWGPWNFLSMVDLLLEHGAEINAEDMIGQNAIIIATSLTRPVEGLEGLMSRGADWKGSNDSALHAAAHMGYLKALQFFISKDADVNVRNANGEIPLMATAMCSGENVVAMMDALVAGGADWHLKDLQDNSVLHLAALWGNVDAIKFSIAKGVDVNGRNKRGMTPLLKAASGQTNFTEVVNLLVEGGACINAVDELGQNVVMLAARGGKSAVEVDQVVKLGGSWEATDNFRHSALHKAAEMGNLEVIRYLIEKGTDVNAANKFGVTPLLHAVEYARERWAETVELLVEMGADMNKVGDDGNNAVILAFKGGKRMEEMKKLMELGCHWLASNRKGETIFEKVKETGNSEVLEYFMVLRSEEIEETAL